MLRLLLAFCAALILITSQSACSDDRIVPLVENADSEPGTSKSVPLSTTASANSPIFTGVPIPTGQVFLRGQIVQPPYSVTWSDSRVFVNGEVIAETSEAPGKSSRQMVAKLERELFNGRSAIVFENGIVGYTGGEGSMTLLGGLAGAKSIHRMIELVLYSDLEGVDDVTTGEWQAALQNFQPDKDFVDQYLNYEASMESADVALNDDFSTDFQVHDSTQTMYGLSVVGMVLIALSAGTLLGHPPKNSRSWSRIVRSPRTLAAMQRCLLLIAAYSLFDLAATLLSVRTGHVEELNPLGVDLVLAPAALAAFKLASVCLGAGLLWKLKNYHGAQVASWWLCMVLTLVTVRWVTVQSLFFV